MLSINIKDIPIYIINLKKDSIKYSCLYENLINHKFTNINRFEGIFNKSPRIGCASSHLQILSSNIEPPYIILEDDCVIMNDINKIKITNKPDAIYLGISKCGYYDDTGTIINSKFKLNKIFYKKIDTQNVCQIYNMLSTHAILYLSKDYIKQTIKVCNFYISIDDYFDKGLADIMKYNNVLALSNPLFYQTSNEQVTKFKLTSLKQKYYNKI